MVRQQGSSRVNGKIFIFAETQENILMASGLLIYKLFVALKPKNLILYLCAIYTPRSFHQLIAKKRQVESLSTYTVIRNSPTSEWQLS